MSICRTIEAIRMGSSSTSGPTFRRFNVRIPMTGTLVATRRSGLNCLFSEISVSAPQHRAKTCPGVMNQCSPARLPSFAATQRPTLAVHKISIAIFQVSPAPTFQCSVSQAIRASQVPAGKFASLQTRRCGELMLVLFSLKTP